ncbi:hypothetical protein JRI60_39720 [Archangium violaceum]|uniref:vitamin K epoxide reductase family protein n=1 Tax=Archangium violaceum TaxID=83451 RepID=UPI00194F9ABA|nr:vitamin K epoxide reductase family protein [Archangium violaceum]QRN95162.1 hypothetical protein JRI60_39720 [Archangium violaceum]
MLRDSSLPHDTPALALAEVVRRRGLRYSRAHVREAFRSHPQPTSLLAAVEVARSVGLEPTAGQGDLETLEETEASELPAILHFVVDGEEGFGLLEAVLPGAAGVRVWDSRNGSQELTRDELVSLWSGVIVFLEPQGEGAPERGYLPRRARELLLEEWRPRTGLVGSSSSPVVRWGLGVMAVLLLGLATSALPAGVRGPGALLAGLTALGLAASLTALAWTRGQKASVLCGGGGPVDCESVLLSDWARIAGVPLSGLGAAFFGASLLVQCTSALSGSVAPAWLAGAAFLPTLPVSALLVVVQLRMRRFCTLCMAVHAVDAAGAAVFLLGLAPRVSLPPEGLLPAALLLVFLFGLLLSSTVPHLSRKEEDDSRERDRARLERSPLTSLARLTGEKALPVDAGAVGVRLGGGEGAPHTLVMLASPGCKQCGPLLEQLEGVVARHGDVLRVHVGVPPIEPGNPREVALCEALACVGVAFGGGVFLQAFRAAKQAVRELMKAPEPLAELAALTGLDRGALEAARETARAQVRAATMLKVERTPGVPAFFFDDRRCEAPLSHVEAWCVRPGLLSVLAPPETKRQEGKAP